MDLFNPPKLFNYKTMSHKLDVSKLDNPYVQVIWEDTPENFTQERIKSVKQYFQKKYVTTNVNVITKVKLVEDETMQTVDVSFNIMDKNYQTELVKSFLKSKGYDNYSDEVLRLDNAVENKILSTSEEVAAFKKWYIKKIKFSNFLSYGENQVLDFEKCGGITVVESDPPNFGGKTVLTVDLLMFLFFNTTTKTTKAEEIFNRFTDKDKVRVEGEITIDGEDYLIVRTIERKKSKAGEWNVKTELDFFKKLADGQLQNFTGEQRRETEKFIKNSIGEQEDFLMTILTTATNLEDLIESKPTARGQVLTKFLGLEFLKKKEETGKELYSEFSKGMLSNIYNTETLKQDNDSAEQQISTFESEIEIANKNITDVTGRLKKGQEYKEGLITSKHTDIDQELIIMNPNNIELEIQGIVNENSTLKRQISEVNVVEPSSYYHEDQHDKVKEEYNEKYKVKVQLETKISDIKKLQSSVEGGIQCEHCGINLMNAAITQAKIAELAGFITQYDENEELLNELTGKEESFVQLKKEFDQYEKNKLIKSKFELTLESNELKKSKLDDKLKRYFDVQEKIKKNNEIEQKLIKANILIEELEREKRQYENTVTSNSVQIKNLNDKIKKNNEYIITIAQEFEKERIYKIYSEVFGKNGISKLIMKTMMPLINSELQRLLQDSSYFRLEIRISDKNEVEFWMIDNSTGVEKLMVSGSGYERTIASLALRAVLSKVCSLPKPNIIVFDEVFGKISNDNLDMVSEFFQKIKEYFEKIFVITHNPLVTNWADAVVKINKVDNISKVSQ
jgi:DNA repair exonuclease SbcCD ATPase subunit